MGIIKGQNLRLSIGGKYVAFATDCTLHVTANLEESSTKDSTNDFSEQEVTGLSWDISTSALYSVAPGSGSGADATGMDGVAALDLILAKQKVAVIFEQCEGTKNRQQKTGTAQFSGYVIINDISVNATNRQNATYTLSATGVGALAKATAS